MVWNSVTGGGKYMHFIINRLKNAIDASLKDPNTRSEDRFQGVSPSLNQSFTFSLLEYRSPILACWC